MAVFHQMGHHSNNLVDLPDLSAYAGAIFSPINCAPTDAAEQISDLRTATREFEIIFDPQLYVPASNRGKLKKWAYFPTDIDTGDPTSLTWWRELNERLANVCKKAAVDSVCSPAVIPKIFDDKYYSVAVDAGNNLVKALNGTNLAVIQTVVASFADLSRQDRALEIASIVSGGNADRLYLVFEGTTFPRRELTDGGEILGAMRLISALERNGLHVIVGFCSSDVLLWKTAGASACASGKFFNLRRFTRQRFEEPNEGGGQIPYWFEESLLAFIRQSDLARVRKLGLISQANGRNPFGQAILAQISEKLKSWLALSWRQFLFWFADVEQRIASGTARAEDLLKTADANWSKLDSAKVLMEERTNDGAWIRSWLNTVREFDVSSTD